MLPIGKVPNNILKDVVFKYLGVKSENVIDGPHVAGDSAIIKVGNRNYIALKTDPITGAVKNIGRHAIIINSNDIISRGAIPKYFMATILLPPKSSIDDLKEICMDLHNASLELNISIIGGHSEVTDVVSSPVIIGQMIGEIDEDNLLDARNIDVGDQIILTKSVGIEGCSIIAHDHYNLIENLIEEDMIKKAKNLIDQISVYEEGLIARKIGGVKFMHDPTEGGLIGGLIELCEFINKGFIIYEDKIPIYPEVEMICKALEIGPLRLLGRGALIIICERDSSKELIDKIKTKNVNADIIGEIIGSKFKIVKKNGNTLELSNETYEELWRKV